MTWLRFRFISVSAVIVLLPVIGLSQSTFEPERNEFKARVEKMLLDRQYAELETIAETARADLSRYNDGGRKLGDFYESMMDRRGGRDYVHRAHDRVLLVKGWHEAAPSFTSRIALAEVLDCESTAIRNSDDAETPESERKMLDLGNQADQLLREADKIQSKSKIKDPYLAVTWMKVGLYLSFPTTRLQNLLDRALQIDPFRDEAIAHMSLQLLPSWFGDKDDLVSLAKRLARQTKKARGDAAYAVVAIQSNSNREATVDGGKFEWSRVQAGLRDLINSSPDSPYYWGQLARFAHLANDRPVANEAVNQLRGRWHTGVFSEREDYVRTERWAYDQSVANPAEIKVEYGPEDVIDVVFVREGRQFIASTQTQTLQIRSSENGKLIETLTPNPRADHLAPNRDGDLLVYATDNVSDSVISIMDLGSKEVVNIGSQTGRLCSLCLSPDEKYVVVGSYLGMVRIWQNAKTPIPYEWSSGRNDRISDVAFSPDSEFAVTIAGNQLKYWHLGTREERKKWEVDDPAWALAISPKGDLVATSGGANYVNLWTSNSAHLGRCWGGNSGIPTMVFSPDGKRLVAGTMSDQQPQLPGQVVVWDVEKRSLIHTYTGHRMGVWKVAISPDGKKIASASRDGTARIWPMP